MLVQADPEASATYVALRDRVEVVRTVHISDAVMVDLDESGEPVGIEILRLPWQIDEELVAQIERRFPKPASALRQAVEQTLYGPSQ